MLPAYRAAGTAAPYHPHASCSCVELASPVCGIMCFCSTTLWHIYAVQHGTMCNAVQHSTMCSPSLRSLLHPLQPVTARHAVHRVQPLPLCAHHTSDMLSKQAVATSILPQSSSFPGAPGIWSIDRALAWYLCQATYWLAPWQANGQVLC
jgi:hypothetical protein